MYLILLLLAGIFVNNYVLSQFLGICPFLGVSKKGYGRNLRYRIGQCSFLVGL